MSTHNICLRREIRKLFTLYPLLSTLTLIIIIIILYLCQQIFGPVMQLLKFKDIDDVIDRANKNMYGLAGAVVTPDIEKALHVAHGLRAGTVWYVYKIY